MNIVKIYEGKFPPFWDVNEWFSSCEEEFLILNKDKENRRVLTIRDLRTAEVVHSEKSLWNSIIGVYNGFTFICKVEDARSHIQIRNFACYNIKERTLVWLNKEETFLLEKYKYPSVNPVDFPFMYTDTKKVNLLNGEISANSPALPRYWRVNENFHLYQQGKTIFYRDEDGKIVWKKPNFYGHWFQGFKKGILYFLLPNCKLQMVEAISGDVINEVFLKDIKKTTGQLKITGFEQTNTLSYDKTSVYDVIINDNSIFWIDSNNNLIIKKSKEINKIEFQENIYLSEANKNYIVLYSVSDGVNGKLISVKWRN